MNIEKEIRNVTAEITELPQADIATVTELLEHNEWGVALEHLCATIIEEGILIPETMFDLIKKLGEEMELKSMNWWEDYRSRVIG